MIEAVQAILEPALLIVTSIYICRNRFSANYEHCYKYIGLEFLLYTKRIFSIIMYQIHFTTI